MSDRSAECDRLKREGDEHYQRKEYAIAAECYRAATDRGPCDHETWFNYGFSLAEAGKPEEAVKAYEMAIRAGSGAGAQNNLGLCYGRLGRHQEAREAFIKATQLERDYAPYWRNLAACFADLKSPKQELQARETLVRCEGCSAGDWNKLGCARERDGDFEGGLAAFRRAALAAPMESAYSFNIALMHERSGRVLDAFHACRHALRLDSSYESAKKMLPRLEQALERPPEPPPPPTGLVYKFTCPHCAQRISSDDSVARTQVNCPSCGGAFCAPPAPPPPREIGPHDYVNPYTLFNVPGIFGLVEVFDWFHRPKRWEEILGSLNRSKRALKAELELNDGRLSWLPELIITEAVMHRVLSELDDDGWHPHHWVIFRLPLLNRFLMHGEPAYFFSPAEAPYPIVAELLGANTAEAGHPEFMAFLGPYFGGRWGQAIKQALDKEDYEKTRALFSSSPPVRAADLDEALEPVRRHFARRRETLKTVAEAIEAGKGTPPDPRLSLAGREARLLNVLPSSLGSKIREDMGYAYRNISVAQANHRSDYIASEQALKAAESFHVSVTLQQRLAEDGTAIAGLLRRDAEAKFRLQQQTLCLTLTNWFRKRSLAITPERFSWGEESLAAEDMDGVRYGITIHYTNGARTSVDTLLALRGGNGVIVSTTWLGEDYFSQAARSVLALYARHIVPKVVALIEKGGYEIGHLRLTKEGVAFKSGLIFTKPQFIPWREVVTIFGAGAVELHSRFNLKVRTSVNCREYWNACLLPTLIDVLKDTPR